MSKKKIIASILAFIISLIFGIGIGIRISSPKRLEVAELHRHARASQTPASSELRSHHLTQLGVHSVL